MRASDRGCNGCSSRRMSGKQLRPHGRVFGWFLRILACSPPLPGRGQTPPLCPRPWSPPPGITPLQVSTALFLAQHLNYAAASVTCCVSTLRAWECGHLPISTVVLSLPLASTPYTRCIRTPCQHLRLHLDCCVDCRSSWDIRLRLMHALEAVPRRAGHAGR